MGPRCFLLSRPQPRHAACGRDEKGMALNDLAPHSPAPCACPCLAGVGAAVASRRGGPNSFSGHPKTVRGTPPHRVPRRQRQRQGPSRAAHSAALAPAAGGVVYRHGCGAPPPHKSRFGAPSGGLAAQGPPVKAPPPRVPPPAGGGRKAPSRSACRSPRDRRCGPSRRGDRDAGPPDRRQLARDCGYHNQTAPK